MAGSFREGAEGTWEAHAGPPPTPTPPLSHFLALDAVPSWGSSNPKWHHPELRRALASSDDRTDELRRIRNSVHDSAGKAKEKARSLHEAIQRLDEYKNIVIRKRQRVVTDKLADAREMDSEFSSCETLESMSQHGSSGPLNLTLEYLRNITNNFSDDRLLGEGGFGTVYKGLLPNGETVAVKKFHSRLLPGVKDRQFENEARHLKRLKHPNIVLLLGWCTETEHIYVEYNGKHVCAEKSERMLCLEYMPNGNLRQYLKDESSRLTWETRYKIIKGICYGLYYLHEESQLNGPIVHMDLKPANILLDKNMVPKIADFGLSRLFREDQTKTCTISRDGTLGYMAPEYASRGIISTKSDIFSLGVITIEVITGQKDYPDETGGISSHEFTELVLKNWRNRWQKSLEIDYHQIKRCVQIGLDCVKLDRSKRPTIRQVIKMLEEIESAVQSHPTLTDDNQDYTEEVNGPLYNKAEASDRLKGTHNYGFSKGKKRERDEQVIDPAKLHRDSLHNMDNSEPGSFRLDDMESKIAKIKKYGLANAEAVEELVRLMELDRTEQRIDLSVRVILVDVIAATEKPDILHVFVKSRGLLVLNNWLQEAHKGKYGEADKLREEHICAMLCALARMPINLSALQKCSIGKSVNSLRSHKNMEIQKKSKALVLCWKKRIDDEMEAADVRPLVLFWKRIHDEMKAADVRPVSAAPSTCDARPRDVRPVSAAPSTCDARPRPKRQARPNKLFAGPEWDV